MKFKIGRKLGAFLFWVPAAAILFANKDGRDINSRYRPNLVVEVPEGEFVPPRVMSRQKPKYPPKLKEAGIEGSVKVWVVIDESGAVAATGVQTSSGFPSMDEAACQAMSDWYFEPARRNDKPTTIEVSIWIHFELARPQERSI